MTARSNPPAPRTLLAALALAALAPATAWSQDRIVRAEGSVLLNGQPVAAGAALADGRLQTGADGRVQVRMASGALIVLPPDSAVVMRADVPRAIGLAAGGLRLSTAGSEWRVELPDRDIRTNGYLKLQPCAAGCTLPPGLYGRIAQGEAVLEYRGGRSVLRGRNFRWADAGSRPELLSTAPALLDDASTIDAATRARAQVAVTLKAGLDAFAAGDDAAAQRALDIVAAQSPGEPLVSYYLGLIALKQERNAEALRLLQQYAREDPAGAAQREVAKTLTVLSSTQLQQEVATAVAREQQVAATPPEPGSIAVQAFVNRGSESYRALAKGLAAMIIADLSKVPGLTVLEREKVQSLIDEAKLGDAGLADTSSAVRSGRLMRAEKVVVGNFEVK